MYFFIARPMIKHDDNSVKSKQHCSPSQNNTIEYKDYVIFSTDPGLVFLVASIAKIAEQRDRARFRIAKRYIAPQPVRR